MTGAARPGPEGLDAAATPGWSGTAARILLLNAGDRCTEFDGGFASQVR